MRGHAVGEAQQADDVLQQAAQPGVVELLGSGSFAIGGGDVGVGEDGGQQQFQVWIGERIDKAQQLAPQRLHVIRGGGHEVGFLKLVGVRLAKLLHLHLQAVVETLDAAAHLDHVAAFEGGCNAGVCRFPRAGLQLPRLVAEDQVEIGLVRLRGAQLPGQNQKKSIEQLSFFEGSQIRYKNVFHSGGRLQEMRGSRQTGGGFCFTGFGRISWYPTSSR